MGIFIPNLKKPSCCAYCWFFHQTLLRTRNLCEANDDEEICGDIMKVDPFCPIKDVKTPHGNLKDTDALLAQLPDVWLDIEYCGYIENTITGHSCDRISAAPTIIEAEE